MSHAAILVMTGADGAAPSMHAQTRCFLTGGMRAVASGGVWRVVRSVVSLGGSCVDVSAEAMRQSLAIRTTHLRSPWMRIVKTGQNVAAFDRVVVGRGTDKS